MSMYVLEIRVAGKENRPISINQPTNDDIDHSVEDLSLEDFDALSDKLRAFLEYSKTPEGIQFLKELDDEDEELALIESKYGL